MTHECPTCKIPTYAEATKATYLFLVKCQKCGWSELEETRRKEDIPIEFENRRKETLKVWSENN
jgi:Zn ribbon nucleic-acid-binding protein